jgi:hypothetical protein
LPVSQEQPEPEKSGILRPPKHGAMVASQLSRRGQS